MYPALPIRFAPAAALAVLLATAAPVAAQTVQYEDQRIFRQGERVVRGIVGIGLTGGGDRLTEVEYTNGDSYSIRGGGEVQVHVGAEFRLSRIATLAVTGGYHFDSVSARNGSVTFERFPIETLAHVWLDQHWRVGGGLRVAMNPELYGDGAGRGLDIDFHTAYSPVLEVEYRFTPSLGLKGRAVFERYRPKSDDPTARGDHLGIVFNFYF